MHPLQIISGFFFNIFALALIACDVYFVREWYYHKDVIGDERYTQWCIAGAVACLLLTTIGRFVFKIILGRHGDDEPNMQRSNETQNIKMADGNTIQLEYYGKEGAPQLLFIHGWSSNSTQWYYVKKHLSSRYRIILMDLPGCGNSSKKKIGEYSPEAFAKDLNEVLNISGIKKPIILGHSIGGMTILNYCKLYNTTIKDNISGLVLIQTTYTNPVKTSIMSKLLTALEKPVLRPMCYVMIGLSPIIQIMNWIKYFNGSMHLNNHITGYAGTETKGQLNLTSLLSTVSPVDVVSKGMLGMFKYDATFTLPTITVPVLIIAGNKDKLCKPDASVIMNTEIPNSELIILSPSGHMGPLERNDQILKAIDDFGERILKNF